MKITLCTIDICTYYVIPDRGVAYFIRDCALECALPDDFTGTVKVYYPHSYIADFVWQYMNGKRI